MTVRVVIQSRLSSSRLPGKAMLTLAGMPAVVLAARRAGNTGLDVVVATSDQGDDDVLAAAHGQRPSSARTWPVRTPCTALTNA